MPTEAQILNCPACGATLDPQPGQSSLQCPYCKTTVKIPEAFLKGGKPQKQKSVSVMEDQPAEDPLIAFLEKQVSRVWCVHLKDIYDKPVNEARQRRMNFHEAVRHGIFAPLGKGSIDFSEVISLLQRGHFEGWVVVEADVLPGGVGADAPLPNAIAGREYLRRLGI